MYILEDYRKHIKTARVRTFHDNQEIFYYNEVEDMLKAQAEALGRFKPDNPTPLTFDLIEKCDRAQMEKVKDFLLLVENRHAKTFWFGVNKTQHQLKYVHQLQDFYFAATGEELKVYL